MLLLPPLFDVGSRRLLLNVLSVHALFRNVCSAVPVHCPQAKTTKKITLRLTCTNCKSVRLKPIKRSKHFEICDKKPKGKQMY